MVVAAAKDRVVFHQRGADASRVRLPLEIFEEHPEVSVRFDLSDPFLAICTPAVPPLFADNFDFQGGNSLGFFWNKKKDICMNPNSFQFSGHFLCLLNQD